MILFGVHSYDGNSFIFLFLIDFIFGMIEGHRMSSLQERLNDAQVRQDILLLETVISDAKSLVPHTDEVARIIREAEKLYQVLFEDCKEFIVPLRRACLSLDEKLIFTALIKCQKASLDLQLRMFSDLRNASILHEKLLRETSEKRTSERRSIDAPVRSLSRSTENRRSGEFSHRVSDDVTREERVAHSADANTLALASSPSLGLEMIEEKERQALLEEEILTAAHIFQIAMSDMTQVLCSSYFSESRIPSLLDREDKQEKKNIVISAFHASGSPQTSMFHYLSPQETELARNSAHRDSEQ